MKRTVILFIAASLLCAVGAAHGGIREHGFEIGVRGGIQSGDGETSVATDPMFGVSVAYALSPKLMAAFAYDRFDTTRDYKGVAGDPSQPANQVAFSHPADTVFSYFAAGLTANFLTDRDVKTIPYLNVAIGIVSEERTGAAFCIDLNRRDATQCNDINPDGTQVVPGVGDPSQVDWQRFIDDQDTGTTITLGAGARTFFAPWFGVTYEVRYFHLDTFNVNQDAFQMAVGATFILGGSK